MSRQRVLRELLDETCWEYVIRQREAEDAYGAVRQAEINFEAQMDALRQELLMTRPTGGGG